MVSTGLRVGFEVWVRDMQWMPRRLNRPHRRCSQSQRRQSPPIRVRVRVRVRLLLESETSESSQHSGS